MVCLANIFIIFSYETWTTRIWNLELILKKSINIISRGFIIFHWCWRKQTFTDKVFIRNNCSLGNINEITFIVRKVILPKEGFIDYGNTDQPFMFREFWVCLYVLARLYSALLISLYAVWWDNIKSIEKINWNSSRKNFVVVNGQWSNGIFFINTKRFSTRILSDPILFKYSLYIYHITYYKMRLELIIQGK